MEYIYSPVYPIARRALLPTSHRSGWALYWAELRGAKVVTSEQDLQLDHMLQRGDRVLVYHGMEWNGQLNIFNGWAEALADRFALLRRLAERLKDRLVSLDISMPAYGSLLKERALKDSFARYRDLWLGVGPDELDRALRKSSTWLWAESPEMPLMELAIGDSHVVSQMAPRTRLQRYDAQTLYGVLQEGLVRYVLPVHKGEAIRNLTFYLGNIDLRHHLARPGAVGVKELLTDYERQLREVQRVHPQPLITLVQPLPIEDETRNVPKSGWYKGAPFCGSWHARHALRTEFDDRLRKVARRIGASYREHPKHWTGPDGKLSFDAMEKPGSVHIRPSEYRHRQLGHEWRSF